MKTDAIGHLVAPVPYVANADELQASLRREWLITNSRGGYASSTVLGIPTRKYHGLLVAAARPPLQRWLLLSATLEKMGVSGRQHEMSSFQFDRTIHPRGYEYQTEFAYNVNASAPWARFTYEHDGARLIKEITVPRGRDEVIIRYSLQGPVDEPLSLEIYPLTPMRDYHSVTRAFPGSYEISEIREFVAVDAYTDGPRLWLTVERLDSGSAVTFKRQPDWWYGFYYPEDAGRGVECREDLFMPGFFRAEGRGNMEIALRAVAGFGDQMQDVPGPAAPIDAETRLRNDLCVAPSGPFRQIVPDPSCSSVSVEQRLREAADAFVVLAAAMAAPG